MRPILLALALVLALPAAAAATPRLKLVSKNGIAPEVQSGGWLLSQAGDTVRLVDERGDRVIERPLGGCSAKQLRYPQLLLGCPGAAFMDVRSGAVRAVPGGGGISNCDRTTHGYARFGRHWLATSCLGHDGTLIESYFNWRSGEIRTGFPGEGPAETYFDLDDPGLPERRLARCAGSTEGFAILPRWTLLSGDEGLRARRCGGGRATLLARDAIGAAVEGDRVVWHSPTKITVRDLRTGRTYRWNVPKADQRAGYTTRVSLTERSLWVEVPQGSGPGPSNLLFRARLP